MEKNKKKIKWLILGYLLLFVILLSFYLINSTALMENCYEVIYLSLVYVLTLPFIVGRKVIHKKVIYPLYFLLAILLSLFAYKITYFGYSIVTLFLFAVAVTPIIYQKLSKNNLKKTFRVLIPLLLLIISVAYIFNETAIFYSPSSPDISFPFSFTKEERDIYVGKYKISVIDNQNEKTELRLIVTDDIHKFKTGVTSNYYNYYNTTLEVYKNDTLKQKYYFINTSVLADSLTIECLGSNDGNPTSKLDEELDGTYVYLSFKDDVYELDTAFINDITDKVVLSKVDEFEDTPKNTVTKEFYFYDDNHGHYGISYSEPSEDKTVLSHYTCTTDDCSANYATNYFSVIKDSQYYVFNVKTGKITNTLSTTKKYGIMDLVMKDNLPVGLLLDDMETTKLKMSYYDFAADKETIDTKMCDYIRIDSNVKGNDYLYCTHGDYSSLVDTNGNIVKAGVTGSIGDSKDNVYFYESDYPDGIPHLTPTVKKLYDKDFNIIYTAENNEEKLKLYNIVTDKDSITYATNKKFYTYKSNTKTNESKEEYKDIYKIFNDYAIVNKDDYVTIIDYKEKVVTTLCKLTSENKIKETFMLNDNSAIVIRITDPNITVSDIEVTEENKDILNDKEKFEKYKEDHAVYEYTYYINEARLEKKADFI